MDALNKGESAERELAEMFREKGLTAIRVPLSGRQQPLPDVIVPHRGVLYGFEVKHLAKEEAVLYQQKFDNLIDWLVAMRRGGIPARAFLAVKLPSGWFFNEVDYTTSEIRVPNSESLGFSDMLRVMRGGKRKKRRLNVSVRIMGDKADVYRVLGVVKEALESAGYSVSVREYVMYKDKKTRTEVDTTRTRVYLSLSEVTGK